ncbi:MAG TPA: peptidylprolyl isomerase [Gemmatimonadales bacterium]|nr:peptidylprolyl isomerase [Gemmatimonadales bacterium]
MKTLLAVIAGLALVPAAAAQQPIDRIVAIVGTRPILASQVDEEMVQQQAQGQPLPPDSAGRMLVRHQVLDHLIEEELLVQQAQRDTSIKITEQEVLDQVEQTYQNVHKQFSSEIEFREQIKQAHFGSVEEWRRWLADEQRRQLYAQRLIEAERQKGKLKPIPPTDAQMREFWEQNRGQQPHRPATIGFRQIVVRPMADSAARARALQLAESLVVQLRHGADFGVAAKRFSGDSASASQGGELGWFRRGVMVKEFEDWAFHMRPGDISEPVETAFGFHIINIERTQPAEVLGRHILIVPEISPAQISIAHRLADSVHDALAQSGASFDALAKAHADPQEQKIVEDAPFDKLPPEYQQVVAADTTLGLKRVITLGGDSPHPKFVVLDVTSRHAEGELTYEDVKLNIRQTLGDQLAIRHFIDQLKRQTYIDVRL